MIDIRALADEVVARTIEIAQVPAPHGAEQRRAEVVGGWWRDAGFDQVRTDEVGNCWARARAGAGPAVVLAAHLDTVFGPETEHVVNRSGHRLVGPSVGDDSVALAALGAVGRLIAASDGSAAVLLVATVGEEGYGLLAGARHAVAHPPMELGAFIAVEGNYLGRLGTVGIGSQRWRVLVTGPGGHAWEQSTAASAVHEAGRLVHALSLVPTMPGTTSLNVGKLEGGEAINAKGRRATFELELRGIDDGQLEALDVQARSVLGPPSTRGLSIDVSDAGSRPAGRVDPGHELVQRGPGRARGAWDRLARDCQQHRRQCRPRRRPPRRRSGHYVRGGRAHTGRMD